MTAPPDLHARIDRFTRTPCAETPSSLAPKTVVLVPPQRPVDMAFARARAILDGGAPAVRIVATCAPLESAWPDWTRTRPGLLMTEIGAYRARSRIESTGAIRTAVRAWLDDLLRPFGAIDAPSRAFYGSACYRLFNAVLDTHPFVPGLAVGLAGCHVECVEEWTGAPVLDALLAPSGGRCVAPNAARSSPRRATWRLELAARASAYGAGALVEAVRAYLAAGPTFTALQANRAREAALPTLWVTLIPTWFRMNRHVLQSVVEPELARGTALGAMFFGELGRGERDEHQLRRLVGTSLWGGLRESRERLSRSTLEQVVLPDSPGALARSLGASAVRAARATWRIATGPRELRVADYRVDVTTVLAEIAKLASVDVVRATLAEHATRAVARRHPMRGIPAVLATTMLAETAVVNVVLNDEGALTVDFVHGTQGDGWPSAENNATVRVVWTRPDADAIAPTGQRCIVAGMPRPVLSPRERPRTGRRVLILSAYLHRDGVYKGLSPFVYAQHELLSVVDGFRDDAPGPERVVFRWRPHPADLPEKVDAVRAKHAPMELSRGAPLAEDLAWCDAVISTPSSAVFEALFADVPVFLQAQPELWSTPVTACLDPARVFYWASDGVAALRRCITRLEAGDESELAPERAARIRLFGDSGEPRTVEDALSEIRAMAGKQAPDAPAIPAHEHPSSRRDATNGAASRSPLGRPPPRV